MITNGQTIMLEYLVLGAVIVVPVWLVMILSSGRGGSHGCMTS